MVKGTKEELLRLAGEGLRARRLSLNLSQLTAAKRSGISLSTLKNLEMGKGASAWALISTCRTYGYDGWILGLAPEETVAEQLRAQISHPRQRAAKRREVSHV